MIENFFRISFKDTKLRLQAPANSLCSVSIVDKGMKIILCQNKGSLDGARGVCGQTANLIEHFFRKIKSGHDFRIQLRLPGYVIFDFGFERSRLRSCSLQNDDCVRYCHLEQICSTPLFST